MSAALRPMTAADVPQVVEIERAAFGDEAWTTQMLLGELEQQPGSRHYLIAAEEGRVVGYAGLLVASAQGDVATLAVEPGHWGRGIGSALLEALMAEAARRGCAEIFLEVRTDNSRAQRLYRRYGFAEVGIRRGYYQPSGADALVMRRELADADPVALGSTGDRP